MLKDLINRLTSDELKDILEIQHAFDIAQALDELDEEEKKTVINLLSMDKLTEVLSYLEPEIAADILSTYSLLHQKVLVSELDPDDAADIINELEEENKNELLKILDKDEEVLSLIQYDESLAGAYMTNAFVKVNISNDVKQATKKVIDIAEDVSTIQTIFVVDHDNHYCGEIPLKTLLKSKYPLTVKDILTVEPTFHVNDGIDNLLKHIKHYGNTEVGIVDEENRLLGIITQDDVLDIYLEETQEDYEKLAALPDTDFKEGSFKTAMHRIPWLLILLAISIPSAFVTSNFTGILGTFVILAFFQPLILDAGGDVASQTLAVTLIELTKKDSKVISNGFKEILTGVINGFVMGLISFLITIIFSYVLHFDHGVWIGLSVGLSLWITVIIGPILGFFIPLFIKMLKFDPAVASGPFITNLIDILSNVVYFSLATIILGGFVA